MKTKTKKSDVSVTNTGSVMLFSLLTRKAAKWVEENVYTEGWQWMGKSAFAVDCRYAPDLASGMSGDGLIVE